MLSTLDILYIVLAFSALWVTVFVCWFIWQIAVVIKMVSTTLNQIRFAADKIEEAINGVKSKFEDDGGHLGVLASHAKKFFSKK